jgi:hypothetical protein
VTVYLDNPAGRLHDALARFRGNVSGQAVWLAWAGALDVPSEDVPELVRNLALVLRLPDDIATEFATIDETEFDRDQVMRWREQIVPALGPGLFSGKPSNQLASEVSDASLSSLEWCSWVLHRHRPQLEVTAASVQRIMDLLRDLDAELTEPESRADADIDPELRYYLMSQVNAMRRALRDLQIRGPVAVEEALDQARGSALRRTDLTSRWNTTEGNRSAWKKFVDLMVVVATVLNISTASLTLPNLVRQELEGPQPVKVEEVQQPQAPALSGPKNLPNGVQHKEPGTHDSAAR